MGEKKGKVTGKHSKKKQQENRSNSSKNKKFSVN